jgi:hypothetical protein
MLSREQNDELPASAENPIWKDLEKLKKNLDN